MEKNTLAESERLAAERILSEARDLITETKNRTRRDAEEVDTRFRQRVGDIDFWKSELDSKLRDMKTALVIIL
jgi:tektin-1